MIPFVSALLLGVGYIGIRLGRSVQATQLTRDAGHMYALGADFSLANTQAITAILGNGFNLSGAGDSVLIFSKVVKVYQSDCNAASVANCPNLNRSVFAQRLVLGNPTLRASSFGTPPPAFINSQGNIKPTDYYRESTLIASGFDTFMSLQQGQYASVVEGYFPMPDLSFLNPGLAPNRGYYVRFVF